MTATEEIANGLDGVVAFATEIAEPDRAGGSLRYRGYDVNELAEKSNYEETAYLLLYGQLPSQAQLQERMKISERGFRPLILVGPVGMQAVSTTAGGRIVNRKTQIIAPAEPIEGPPGFNPPAFVFRDSVGFEAGGHCGLGLDRLLIEARALAVPPIETVGTNGYKMMPLTG